jgi:hypothetical protein
MDIWWTQKGHFSIIDHAAEILDQRHGITKPLIKTMLRVLSLSSSLLLNRSVFQPQITHRGNQNLRDWRKQAQHGGVSSTADSKVCLLLSTQSLPWYPPESTLASKNYPWCYSCLSLDNSMLSLTAYLTPISPALEVYVSLPCSRVLPLLHLPRAVCHLCVLLHNL